MTKQSSIEQNLRLLGLRIALGLAAVGALSGCCSFFISSSDSPVQWWVDWLQDVGTEMLGASVTILLVELVIYKKRDEASRLDQERMRRRNHFAGQLKQAQHGDRRQKILLKNADLSGARFSKETHLPNGELWQPDIDWSEFTQSDSKEKGAGLSKHDLS
jgi:hypothetical protein